MEDGIIMSAPPREPTIHLSPGAQAMYDSLMTQLDNIDEITRESLITSQQTIARYERQHHMTSVTMREKVRADEIEETDEICRWLLELESLRLILEDLR